MVDRGTGTACTRRASASTRCGTLVTSLSSGWIQSVSIYGLTQRIDGYPCFAFRRSVPCLPCMEATFVQRYKGMSYLATTVILGIVKLTFDSISEQVDPLSPEDRDQCCVSLEQEVLISYRLLFGQDGMSRKVAQDEICRLKKTHPDQSVDTMLLDLCGRKYKHGSLWWRTYDTVLHNYPPEMWPVTCQTMKGHLLESDVYSARNDFPRLGSRLLKLQQFNLRQRPSKLVDLWRDRRNPLQWYTFWAVVIVGGVANILAALQLLVAIIELQTSF